MTTYLLAAAAAAVLLLFAAWLWRRDDTDTDTAELPVLLDEPAWDWPAEPDLDGWSRKHRGWDYQEIFNAIVDGYDPTPVPPTIFDDLHAKYADRLALPTGEYKALVAA